MSEPTSCLSETPQVVHQGVIDHQSTDIHSDEYDQDSTQLSNAAPFLFKLRSGIWILGIAAWVFGIADRSVALLSDGAPSGSDLLQILTISFFFISWLYLKPDQSASQKQAVQAVQPTVIHRDETYVGQAQARMFELKERHLISQAYVLPYPYLCQIYHLLNLKHLETVHSFSLNNLRILEVSDFQPTAIGGILKFQTVLDSPINALRIWRQPIVEVELILHTPYTVELRIPVYNDKKIIVVFNALPLGPMEHELFIDIYSDLNWPKFLLQPILHFASCLTLFEDLSYLQQLAERNVGRLVSFNRTPSHETMQLFKRFVELYGPSLNSAKPVQALKET